MAVETRIRTAPGTAIRFNVLALGEERAGAGLSSVHLRCTVTLEHATRRLRGGGLALPDRVKPEFLQQPSTSDEVRDLRDPSVLLRPDDVLPAVLDMLASTPVLRGVGLDLSDESAWDGEHAPRRIAAWLREQGSRWLASCPERRCRFEVDARLRVTRVFSEPRAVLRWCAEVAMQTVAPGSDEECRICFDEFRDGGKSGSVNLPCSHAYHAHCMLTWLDRGANCPTCRHDLSGMVAAAPWTAPTIWATGTTASSSTATARRPGPRARGRR
ncbi:hypothetical protein CFC21_044876 [Triticum aestivum]|uniref:RING-type domain-containing protein n=2 Tax=Triticum aestivum TaxID=4565 RepID=A0A9R1FRT5_WHEAT|nr:hypothetical protein CFC21_044876 [Triticum aestivum]CDJ26522.1 unnamed protein product [Triticum aestivum]